MKFELDQYKRNTPDDELIADVKRVALLLGKDAVTIDEQNQHGNFHATTLTRRFGSWMTVLSEAGLKQTRTPLNIPKEDLFRNLEEIWITLGRQPRYQEVLKPSSRYSVGTYEKRFGSWRKALETFVAYINDADTSSEVNNEASSLEHEAMQRGPRKPGRKVIIQVLLRDKGICQHCRLETVTDGRIDYHIDHIKPWSKGGITVLENLQVLCSRCNLIKGDLDLTNDTIIEVQNVEA